MEIRAGSPEDAEAVACMISSFQSDLTDDPSGAGAEQFLASVTAEAEKGYLASARYRYLLAFEGEELVGFISIRDCSHVFHLFVSRAHQRRGIARILWRQALRELCSPNEEGCVTVNSSLAAVPVYEAFGFASAGSKQRQHGISFFPMRYSPRYHEA